jgi:hypothetical protein
MSWPPFAAASNLVFVSRVTAIRAISVVLPNDQYITRCPCIETAEGSGNPPRLAFMLISSLAPDWATVLREEL